MDAAFLTRLLENVLEKFPPDTPVTMAFRKAHFASGHDLEALLRDARTRHRPGECGAVSEKGETIDFGAPTRVRRARVSSRNPGRSHG